MTIHSLDYLLSYIKGNSIPNFQIQSTYFLIPEPIKLLGNYLVRSSFPLLSLGATATK